MFNMFLSSVLAFLLSVTLSVSPTSGPVGEQFKFSVNVSGPFEGRVCLAVYGPEDDNTIVGRFCPSEGSEVSVKDGETESVNFTSTTGVAGTYRFKVVTLDGQSEPKFDSKFTTVTVVVPSEK